MLPELRLSYELRASDLEANAARNATAALSPRFSRAYVSGALLRAAVVFLLHHVLFGLNTALLAGVLGVGVGASWLAWAPVHARRLVLRRIRERFGEPSSAFLLGVRTIEIGPGGFAVLGPESELRYRWSALQRVVQRPERLFLYFTGFNAHVVPLSQEDAVRVIQAISRYAPSAVGVGA